MYRSIAAAVIASWALASTAATAPLKGEDPQQHRKLTNELAAASNLPNLWEGSWQLETGLYHFPGPVEYTAAAAEYVKQYKPKADSPMANCLMPGMPFVMNQGAMPVKFFIAPGMIGLYIETYAVTRFLHTDGRAVDADPNPTFLGTSVAHWEGDALVVDTRGFVDNTLLQIGALPGGRAGFGIPIFKDHGPNLRFLERIRVPDYKTLEITTTIYDDAIFAKPYTSTRVWHRHTGRNADPQEWVCSDNRDRYDEKTDTLHYNYQNGGGATLTVPDPGATGR
jgi:hypothetical protein